VHSARSQPQRSSAVPPEHSLRPVSNLQAGLRAASRKVVTVSNPPSSSGSTAQLSPQALQVWSSAPRMGAKSAALLSEKTSSYARKHSGTIAELRTHPGAATDRVRFGYGGGREHGN
jgi:hypothetical protein